MNKDTSIMTDKSGYYELHPPFFQRNLIAIDTDSDIIKSQLLTNDDADVKEWIEEFSDFYIVSIDRRQERNKSGEFVDLALVDWCNLLIDMYEEFTDDSREHIDAVFQ